MTGLAIQRFFGVVPREHDANLASGYASEALDVRLDHGTLLPWRQPLSVESISPTAKTIYQLGCCWFAWDDCVEVTGWKAGCHQLFVTGSHPWPVRAAVDEDCNLGNETCPGWTRLGVPAPNNSLVAQPLVPATNTDKTEARSYVYTYENCYCEEGPPSYPSNTFTTDDGQPVRVTGFIPPDPEWGATKIILYRIGSGARTGREEVQEHVTVYLKVAELSLDTTEYIDSKLLVDAGTALTTEKYSPPPEGLRGIVTVDDGVTMAGFYDGNKLRFSARHEPWNWPEDQELTLDDNIANIVPSSDFFHVFTDGAVYSIQAELDCTGVPCRKVVKHKTILPSVNCCSDRSVVSTPVGSIAVTTYGLVIVRGDAAPVILTDPWYAKDDWRKLRPETMRVGYYADTVFCVSDTYGFALTLQGGASTKWDTLAVSEISDRPKAFFTSRTGEMFLHREEDIAQWDAGKELRPYKWFSKLYETPELQQFWAGRVYLNGTTVFTLEASEQDVFSRILPLRKTFRLPAYGRHTLFRVKLEGTAEVVRVHLATSAWELRENLSGR